MSKNKKPNLLEQFFNREKNDDVAVEQNKITIFYDEYLQKIIGIPFEETMIIENFTFADFLHSLFISYPEISKSVPPGKLAFLLNEARPNTFDVLKDGDSVRLMVLAEQFIPNKAQIKLVQEQTEVEILDIIKRYEIEISFEKIKEVIFNEKSFKDFHSIIDIFSENVKNQEEAHGILNILMKTWDYFPRKSLEGLCRIEKIPEFQKSNPDL